jgi:hypothetical protein
MGVLGVVHGHERLQGESNSQWSMTSGCRSGAREGKLFGAFVSR